MKVFCECSEEVMCNVDKCICMCELIFMNGEVIVWGGWYKCVIRDFNDMGVMLMGIGIYNLFDDIVEVII